MMVMFSTVQKYNHSCLPMGPAGKINARSILTTVPEENHDRFSMGLENKNLDQVYFKTSVNIP